MGHEASSTESNPNAENSVSRRHWLKAAGGATAGLLAGCSSLDGNGTETNPGGTDGGVGGEDVTIEYWRWPHSTDASNEAENSIVEKFNEMDNGITVEQVKTPFGDFRTKLKTAVSGKNAPAVFWGDPQWLMDPAGKSREEIAGQAPFVYLEDLIPNSHLDQFWESFWVQQFNLAKGIWGVPFVAGFQPGVMYVNVDAWKEADLGELPSGSWSIEEFHQAAKTLNDMTVNGKKVNGFQAGLKDIDTLWFLVMQKGRTFGKIIDEGFKNGDDEYVLTMADDAMRKGWEAWYGTPIDEGWTQDPFAYSYNELPQPFYDGQDALSLHQTWAKADITEKADFEWDILPVPTEGGKDYWVREAGAANMMAVKESFGGKPEAAAEFIKFRTNAQNSYDFFNVSAQAVANKQAYERMKDEGVSDFAKETNALRVMDILASTAEELKDLSQRRKDRYPSIKSQTIKGTFVVDSGIPTGAGGGQIRQIAGTEFQRVLKQDKDAKQALTDIESQWSSVLSDAGHSVMKDSVGYDTPAPKY